MITCNGLTQLGFRPEVDFSLKNGADGPFIEAWNSESPQPSVADIEEGQRQWDAQEYARNRQAEYPSINELIVALWENVVEERAASVISLEATRQAIKAKYPK